MTKPVRSFVGNVMGAAYRPWGGRRRPRPQPPVVTSIQAAVDAASSGSTVTIPAGTYRETVTINKPLTLIGAGIGSSIVDGRDAGGSLVRETWLSVTADDVTVRGFTFQHAAGTYGVGSIQSNSGADRFLLQDCDVSYSHVNINIGGSYSELRDVVSHHATELCLRVAGATIHGESGNRVIRGRYYMGNYMGTGVDGDAGSIKVTYQDDFVFAGGEVDTSTKGLWLDASCLNAELMSGRFHDNDGPGIMDETSTGTKIHDNVCWSNAPTPEWGFNAGILISSSKGAQVYDNLCAWNGQGISVISQDRVDNPGVTDNYVHDNLVCAAQPVAGTDHWGLFWGQDWAGTMYDAGSDNHALANDFYYADTSGNPVAENQYARFIWDGYRDMASFQTVPGGTGSAYVDKATAQTALTAAGVPTHP